MPHTALATAELRQGQRTSGVMWTLVDLLQLSHVAQSGPLFYLLLEILLHGQGHCNKSKDFLRQEEIWYS